MSHLYQMKPPASTQATRWHLPNLLPQGELVLLDGTPGIGKSIFTAKLAARLAQNNPDQKVIYVSSPEQMHVRERFLQMQQSNFEQFLAIEYTPQENWVEPKKPLHPQFASFIEELLDKQRPVCLVIDSLEEILSQTPDADTKMCRDFWIKLRHLANQFNCTIIVPRQQGLHETRQYGAFTKAGSELARFVLAMHWHPQSPDKRVVSVVRHQAGPMGQQFHVQFDAAGLITILELPVTHHVRPAKSPQTWQHDPSEAHVEEQILSLAASFMKGEPTKCQEVKSYLGNQGFSGRAVDRTLSKADLKVVSNGSACFYQASELMKQRYLHQFKMESAELQRWADESQAQIEETRRELQAKVRAHGAREGGQVLIPKGS